MKGTLKKSVSVDPVSARDGRGLAGAYATRRTAEGKSAREIKRCLKRYLARHLYRLLDANPNLHPNLTAAAP